MVNVADFVSTVNLKQIIIIIREIEKNRINFFSLKNNNDDDPLKK